MHEQCWPVANRLETKLKRNNKNCYAAGSPLATEDQQTKDLSNWQRSSLPWKQALRHWVATWRLCELAVTDLIKHLASTAENLAGRFFPFICLPAKLFQSARTLYGVAFRKDCLCSISLCLCVSICLNIWRNVAGIVCSYCMGRVSTWIVCHLWQNGKEGLSVFTFFSYLGTSLSCWIYWSWSYLKGEPGTRTLAKNMVEGGWMCCLTPFFT